MTLVFVLVTWRRTGCGLILDLTVALVTWRWTGCGLIRDLCVCIGDLENDRRWIDSCSEYLRW